MTPIQQQRFIGAALLVLVIGLLAVIILNQVRQHKAEEVSAPAPFESIVDPIDGADAEKNNSATGVAIQQLNNTDQAQADSELDDVAEFVEENEVLVDPQATNTSAPDQQQSLVTTQVVAEPEHTVAAATEPKPVTSDTEKATSTTIEKPATESTATAEKPTAEKPATEPTATAEKPTAEKPATEPTATTEKPATESTATAEKTMAESTTISNDQPRWILQIASFSEKEKAEAQLAQVKALGHDPMIEHALVNGKDVYRVRLKPVTDKSQLEQAKQKIDASLKLISQIQTYKP